MRVRRPAVAGAFYPASKTALTDQVNLLLAQVELRQPAPVALIVPHAGYVYSGSTAAMAYATLAPADPQPSKVVLLGPCHRYGVHGLALPGVDALATPLGEVPVWQDGVDRVSALPQVLTSAAAHAEEHSLEVQLPFLQLTLAGFELLPLAVGWVTATEVSDVLERVWDEPGTVTVVSSDLSHYHDYNDAQRVDDATVAQVLALDGELDHEQACGATGINGLMELARRHGLQPSLLGACNSGDTAGDRRRVVGYAAIAFY